MKKRRYFYQLGPCCLALSVAKECARRNLADFWARTPFAGQRSLSPLPALAKGHCSQLLRPLAGVDMRLQQNKIQNLRLAAGCINGILVQPGQVFSFWKLVGKPTAKAGYLPGLTLSEGRPGQDVGGGLCQLANLIHWLVLHSPLTVTELHHHTDSIFPDAGRRVPFGTGTSIFYKNVDYRFANTTGQPVQLLVWLTPTHLMGELRSQTPFPYKYTLEEEGHCFTHEADGYYRNSRVYRTPLHRETRLPGPRQLLLQNHSKVLYSPLLIPPEELCEGPVC